MSNWEIRQLNYPILRDPISPVSYQGHPPSTRRGHAAPLQRPEGSARATRRLKDSDIHKPRSAIELRVHFVDEPASRRVFRFKHNDTRNLLRFLALTLGQPANSHRCAGMPEADVNITALKNRFMCSSHQMLSCSQGIEGCALWPSMKAARLSKVAVPS